ncbi:ubiquitin-conjugating enzyme E2 H-like [Teleopsis dalmanni]|uniref:ubiquitin-conjugating enzyme E2 H-like n=1 Tax=Teleopsis dalmanni TaxID=139649 RepID=UPI0018CDC0EC|nr:ubiquitin-conjugating enzyme E2 H-like [Teleopsis dalmanni]
MNNDRRKIDDVNRLLELNYEITPIKGVDVFHIIFRGPQSSFYKNGVWKIRVSLPANYPQSPPSITFLNQIYHPNIDALCGKVCLDVISNAWRSNYNLHNVFSHFLPSLLQEPNATDPLNLKAADMFSSEPKEFQEMVTNYINHYATEAIVRQDYKSNDSDDEYMSDTDVNDAETSSATSDIENN